MKQIPENRMHLGGCFKPGEAHGSSLQRSATSGSMTTLTPRGAGWSWVEPGGAGQAGQAGASPGASRGKPGQAR